MNAVVQKLRDRIPSLLPTIYSILLDLGFQLVETNLNARVGEKSKRVFCFGPYLDGGKERINSVARKVSQLGYSALTGFGFYRAHEPYRIHSDREIMPPIVRTLKNTIPGHIFFHEIPKIASRAIFDMTFERGQNDELRGSYDYKIPFLGFIIHRTIRKRSNCMFLANYDSYVECKASDKSLCTRKVPAESFCPFYDSAKMSWFSLQLFLTRENTLVAVRRLDDLDGPLRKFLGSGAKKDARSVNPQCINTDKLRG